MVLLGLPAIFILWRRHSDRFKNPFFILFWVVCILLASYGVYTAFSMRGVGGPHYAPQVPTTVIPSNSTE